MTLKETDLRPALEMQIELNRNIQTAIVPVLAPSLSITLTDKRDADFNAEVATADFKQFQISINHGCALLLERCMADAEAEDLWEVQEGLSTTIFGDAAHALEIRRLMLHYALFFIAFHEIAHVLCGHLQFCSKRDLFAISETGLSFDEQSSSHKDHDIKTEATNWIELIELDADQLAFELLSAFAYEILIAGDGFAELLPEQEDPNDVSQDVTLALGEVIVSAASGVFYLMETQRDDHGDYPSPQTRLQSILYGWARQAIVKDRTAQEEQSVTISPDQRHILLENIVPACFNSAQFGVACAEAIIDDQSKAISQSRIGFDEQALMNGFAEAIIRTNASEPVGAQSFRKLLLDLGSFQNLLVRHPLGS